MTPFSFLFDKTRVLLSISVIGTASKSSDSQTFVTFHLCFKVKVSETIIYWGTFQLRPGCSLLSYHKNHWLMVLEPKFPHLRTELNS